MGETALQAARRIRPSWTWRVAVGRADDVAVASLPGLEIELHYDYGASWRAAIWRRNAGGYVAVSDQSDTPKEALASLDGEVAALVVALRGVRHE